MTETRFLGMKSLFTPEQEGDILRTVAYHYDKLDHVVASVDPLANQPISKPIEFSFPHDPIFGLGDLSLLPTEVIWDILSMLDITSTFHFRQVNRQARKACTTLPGFEAVTRHASGALSVILATGIGRHYLIRDLYAVLCEKQCKYCGQFGGFLYLPTFTRICFYCISLRHEISLYEPKANKDDPDYPDISPEGMLKSLPMVHTLPGAYTMLEKPSDRRYLVDKRQARAELGSSGMTFPEQPSIQVADLVKQRVLQYQLRCMASTALPYLDLKNGHVDHGVSCKACPNRFKTGILANMIMEDRVSKYFSMYARDEFLEHFVECRAAQDYWHKVKAYDGDFTAA